MSKQARKAIAKAVHFLAQTEDDRSVIFRTRARWSVLIERGLFCLLLAFISKYPLHIAIMQWLFLVPVIAYLAGAGGIFTMDLD